ncbi:MAG: hypothetical protein DVB23_001947 [Verrucomicrobia bacterium]|jgi:hypothetical protein|nr:MAG: hypothetical protein DVB23_001947 [Verrucomicrobiota bacterium]
MNFPLRLRFKILTFFTRIEVTDAAGQLVCFVKKKAFKLKEQIEVYGDREMARRLLSIEADRIIDFSAVYSFTDIEGRKIGSVARKGMRSIWRAHYLISDDSGRVEFEVTEENPWIKVLDGFFDSIPVVNLLSGYLLNPSYLVKGPGGELVCSVRKQPAFLEGVYQLEQHGQADEGAMARILTAVIMMVLLERYRG